MATEVLRPQDCLRADNFYNGFSSLKPYPNRRKNRPVRPNQTTHSSNPKHSRPNPKSNRKSPSPPSTSPLSTSPLKEGFRLLKRGENFRPDQTGSETGPLVETKQLEKTPPPTKRVPLLRKSEPSTPPQKTPPPKKTPSDPVRSELATPLKKPTGVGSTKDSTFAGPYFLSAAPEARLLPLPDFLRKTSSVGSTSDDEASRTLRGLLKLDFQ